ncbi:HAD family hydrolase [Deinococcus maricopensis]|uniref:HAD-superfamily hydrolase, subfamily IIB n=1 Tax=Deinococcus maricopensis (strain DSM 21211 / LMG 22137 / NRRL B-23946 / LB-34) TaxID=709986 RepID=E8U321_DEIML|nr:HAD family hydrolase [Deinococcus maricopensis]ADV65759.1 HAD-superfamily hydrolase, subfamily IIB [Deinococcus maricopensis DSM 21211]
MQRLLALDLDGTLLHTDGTLSPRARAALHAARHAGWLILPVTARPARHARTLTPLLGAHELSCSGGALTLHADGHVLDRTPLPTPLAPFVHAARQALPGLALAADWGTHHLAERAYHALRAPHAPPRARAPDDLLPHLSPAPLKLLARHPHHDGPTLACALQDLHVQAPTPPLHVSASSRHFAEVTDAAATKLAAVQRTCARHGLDRAQVLAFGDMPADAPLLAWAGVGVAVANAHADALHAADDVTLSNDQDGVALSIERVLAAHAAARMTSTDRT